MTKKAKNSQRTAKDRVLRNRHGQFAKGISGNPSGRRIKQIKLPADAPLSTRVAAAADLNRIARQLIRRAYHGDDHALATVVQMLERERSIQPPEPRSDLSRLSAAQLEMLYFLMVVASGETTSPEEELRTALSYVGQIAGLHACDAHYLVNELLNAAKTSQQPPPEPSVEAVEATPPSEPDTPSVEPLPQNVVPIDSPQRTTDELRDPDLAEVQAERQAERNRIARERLYGKPKSTGLGVNELYRPSTDFSYHDPIDTPRRTL